MSYENAGLPRSRPRRLRKSDAVRKLIRETRLSREQFILPLFIKEDNSDPEPIASMPGVYRWSVSSVMSVVEKAAALGIQGVLLFGVSGRKDKEGAPAWDEEGSVPRAVRAIKNKMPDITVFTDVCLCGYTDHGHCGILRDGVIDNDATLEKLGRIALCHARAGADFVAPSDMMDGRVSWLRSVLDQDNFQPTGILSYAVKYASAFYGPFREAAESAPAYGDRRTHQMDPANTREAVREALLDQDEGADIIMIKPGLPYLDVIRRVRQNVSLPVAAYSVSGEYSMFKAAAANGWLDERTAVLESMTSMVRAGADIIVTYWALEVAEWLRHY